LIIFLKLQRRNIQRSIFNFQKRKFPDISAPLILCGKKTNPAAIKNKVLTLRLKEWHNISTKGHLFLIPYFCTSFKQKNIHLRNLSLFLILAWLLSSCSTVKPATVVRTKDSGSTGSGSNPQFIESIQVSPSGNSKSSSAVGFNSASAPIDKTNSFFSVNIEQVNELQFKYAILVNVAVEEMYNTKLLQFIEDWYGTRYRYGGSTKQGVDCSYFSSNLVNSVFNISIPRTASEQYQQTEHIQKTDLHTGDLVFFNTRGGVSHVGVYLSNDKFVHASTSNGVMISSLNEEYYNKRFVGAGRPRVN
jgi:lipoprotein Spr